MYFRISTFYIFHTVKYADDLVLMSKEETMLQCTTDKLIETGRCCGMEMNVEKIKVKRISRRPSAVTFEECGVF